MDFVGFLTKKSEAMPFLRNYMIHGSPYCMFIKEHSSLWKRCQLSTKRILSRCEENADIFIGTSFCGISEMVIPVKYGEVLIAAVLVGGFELDAVRTLSSIQRMARKYGIEAEYARNLFKKSMFCQNPNISQMQQYCGIIADFLKLYYQELLAEGVVKLEKVYYADRDRFYILVNSTRFIRTHYMEDIHVKDVAKFCHCSESYINHLFKKHTGQNICAFINAVRIEKAKLMIERSTENFNEIAEKCGFNSSSHFSNVFKRITKLTASQYKDSLTDK